MNILAFIKITKPNEEPRYWQARSKEEYDMLMQTAVENDWKFEYLFTSIEDLFATFK